VLRSFLPGFDLAAQVDKNGYATLKTYFYTLFCWLNVTSHTEASFGTHFSRMAELELFTRRSACACLATLSTIEQWVHAEP